ncbi:MAG: hypothetical protein ACT4N2_01670 [Hyphomicrobium sp.]
MWEMTKSSIALFFAGKLFAEPGKAYAQLTKGIIATLILFLLGTGSGLPIHAAAALAGFLGGALQPYLFKDLRYR